MTAPDPVLDRPVPWWLERIASHGEKDFVYSAGGRSSYAELGREVAAARERIKVAGIEPGDVVVLLGDYAAITVATLLALVERHCIIVPVTPVPAAELETRVRLSGASHILRAEGGAIAWDRRTGERPAPHALVSTLVAAGRAGLILFSSGSTGEPKAMVHDLDRLLDAYRDRRPRTLVLLVFLMFDHIGGLNTLFTSLATGATMVVPANRDPDEVCALIARHRVAILPTSPTFLNLMLLGEAWKRHDLRSLKIITYGTEPMPAALLQRLRAALPHVKLLQTFGTSETGIAHTTSKSSDSTLMKIEDPNVEYRIVEGELWLRSHTQILGYLNHASEAFTADGWFKTGDLVEEADDGFLRIVGRRSELINVGGEKVLPAEVEAVLLEMPEIVDCLAHGEPNAITGQVVCARVVLAPGVDPLEIRKQVRQFCRSRLAAYKIPAKVTAVTHTEFSQRFKKIRRVAPSAS